jgi:hypothetical protein
LADPNYFKSELPFLYEDIQILQNTPPNFFTRRHAASQREAPIGGLNKRSDG